MAKKKVTSESTFGKWVKPDGEFETVIAIDASLTSTGYAEFYQVTSPVDRLTASGITHKVITSDSKGIERVDDIVTEIMLFVEARAKQGPTLVLIENYAYAKTNQAHQLGELGGVLRWRLWQEGERNSKLEYIVVAPSMVKKFTTGRGNAPKNIMIKEVFKRFHVDVEDDNEADAVALLHIGMALIGRYEPSTSEQRKILGDLTKTYLRSPEPLAAIAS